MSDKTEEAEGEAMGSPDPFSLLPDEVLEFVLSLASPYGDLRSASRVSRRFGRAAAEVGRRRAREFARAAADRALRWEAPEAPTVAGVLGISPGEPGGPAGSSSSASPQQQQASTISKRYSHSAVYDDRSLSMYVFGGCTSTSSTFNDLWRLDLTSRSWSRPLATGTYPSPKACAAMVLHPAADSLLLFGGWTHPSLYPLHQSWRLFNELHQYNIGQSRWTHVLPNSSLKPPAMAGHSATVHRVAAAGVGAPAQETMVVFGGLHKQRSSIGHFSSSSDVWCFNLTTQCWSQCDIPEPRPTPRYGQSQLKLDDRHLVILGGCGGPNNIFNDVWLLRMGPGDGGDGDSHWRWFKCEVRNAAAHGAGHLWCHPAVRVADYAVVLGKTRVGNPAAAPGDKARDLGDSDAAQFNVIPQLRRGINRGRGAIRRQETTERYRQQQEQQQQQQQQQADAGSRRDSGSDMDVDDRELAVEPLPDGAGRGAAAAATAGNSASAAPTFKTSVLLNVNQSSSHPPPTKQQSLDSGNQIPRAAQAQGLSRQASLQGPSPSGSGLPRAPPEMARLQAFTAGAPSTYVSSPGPSSAAAAGSSNLGAVPKRQHLETRQRQLESLKRMEERIKTLDSKVKSDKANKDASGASNKGCTCHRLSMFVLDLSAAVSDRVVTWLDVGPKSAGSSNALQAPEETILYSLVAGRSELVLFGGIQKDVSSMTSRSQPASASDTVSNSVYYLAAPTHVV